MVRAGAGARGAAMTPAIATTATNQILNAARIAVDRLARRFAKIYPFANFLRGLSRL